MDAPSLRQEGPAGPDARTHGWGAGPGSLWRAIAAVAGAALMAAWVLADGSVVWRSDRLSLQAQQDVSEWAMAGKGWTLESYQSAHLALNDALQISPSDPVLHLSLAQLYATQGAAAWARPEVRQVFFEEALLHQQQALRLRPLDGATWLQVATSLHALGRPLDEQQHAWQQAARLAGREAPVQLGLVDLALAQWDVAEPGMRQWVLTTYARAPAALQRAMQADAKRRGRADTLQTGAPPIGG